MEWFSVMKRAKKPLLVMLVLCFLLVAILPAMRSYFAAEEPGESGAGDPACAHEYGAWTPTGDGRHKAVCGLCQGEKTEDCDMQYSKTVLPTQTQKGYTEYICAVCGYTEQRDEKVPELERTEGGILGDVDANGRIESSDARALLRAAVSLEAIPDLILPYADMDEDGKITAADARSALRNAVGLDNLNVRHDYSVHVKTPATCTEVGEMNFECGYCGAAGRLEIPTVNHRFKNPVVTPATCTAPGKSVAKCEVCGREQITVIPAKGHTWTGSSSKRCSVCGFTAPNWEQIGGLWYYYTASGVLAKGRQVINGKIYQFDNNGVSRTGRSGADPKVAVIGDSLVETLGVSGVAGSNYDFYGRVSLHADTIFTKYISGSDRVVIDEVKDRGYDIVIIILGENDLDYAASAWAEMYRKVVRGVQERAPGAVVYAHAVFPINESRARANGYSETNADIRATNAVIQRVANEEGVGYLDPTYAMIDGSGQLPYDAATDGIHFGITYSRMWYNWLQTAM